MTRIPILALLCGALACATSPAADEAEYREFTGSNGKVIKAVLVDKTEDTVTLLLENGGRAKVPLEKLSEGDREYIAKWSKEEAVFLKRCRTLTVGQLLALRGYESFPFRLENNSIVVDGTMNGKKARFLIDTGAGTSLLHDGFAKEAGCELGPYDQTIYGVAGEAKAAFTDTKTITMGESVFANRKILCTDLLKDKPPGTKLREDAIFGADFMARLDAVISYKERRIFLRPDLSDDSKIDIAEDDDNGGELSLQFRLFDTKDGKVHRGNVKSKTPTVVTLTLVNGKEMQIPISRLVEDDAAFVKVWSEAGDQFLKHCGGLKVEELLELRRYQSFHYERRGNHLFVEGTLNGNKVDYMIDTGADNSLLHLWAAEKNGCDIGPMDQEVWGIGGKAPAAVTKIKELTMGEAVVTNRKCLTTDLARFQPDDQLGYAGIFGADFMREFDAVITYREDRVFLKRK